MVSRPAEEMLLKILLNSEETIEEIKKHLILEDFQDLRIREIMRIVYRTHTQGEELKPAKLITYLENADAAQIISRISSDLEEFIDRRKSLSDCINRIKMDNFKNRLNKLQREIKLAQSWGRKERIPELVKKYNQLIKRRSVGK